MHRSTLLGIGMHRSTLLGIGMHRSTLLGIGMHATGSDAVSSAGSTGRRGSTCDIEIDLEIDIEIDIDIGASAPPAEQSRASS
jgi:hypothetical protein